MSVSVSMPQLGESVTEGTVTRWLKKEGERVEADEPLLEVSTDKVDTEIPSPASGILRGIVVDEDETVAVGAELAVIEDAEAGAGPASAPAEPAPAAAAPAPGAAGAAPAAPAAGADGAFGNGGTPGWRNGETAEHAGGGQASETAAPAAPSWDPFRPAPAAA